MHKLRVFCILFSILAAIAFQHGCAKKIDSAMSSAGIEDGKTAGVAAKQDKPGGTPGGRVDKEANKGIGEEGIGKSVTLPGDTSSQGISGSIAPEKGGNQTATESIEKKPVIIGQDRVLKGTETGSGEGKDEMAKIEPEPSDPSMGGGESIQRPESRQDGISSEVMKKDEEKPVVSPEKEILVASKEEPGPALEGLRKGREDSGLKDILFDFNSWIIKGDVIGTLEQDAKYLISNPGLKVQIEGHADERGTNEYNLALGERRAKSTRKFLVDMGVGLERITIISYGEERPFCKEHGESCWTINRRGHFLIIDE